MVSVRYAPENETILEINDGRLKVEFADIGEGWNGEYNPSDPRDTQLVRFYIYEKIGVDEAVCEYEMVDEDGWVPVMDSSRCTRIAVDTPCDELERLAKVVFDEFADALPVKRTGASVKSIADRLSWLESGAVKQDIGETR